MDVRTLLVQHEGRVNRLYKCSAGFNTIGVGHNLDANPISDAAIEVILTDDIAEVERQLDASLPWWRNEDPVRQAAMIDLAFNMGVPTLLGFHNTLRCWRDRFYGLAAEHLASSKWFGQVGRRGPRVVSMVRTGEWPK